MNHRWKLAALGALVLSSCGERGAPARAEVVATGPLPSVAGADSVSAAQFEALQNRVDRLERLLAIEALDANEEYRGIENLGPMLQTPSGVTLMQRALDRFPDDDRAPDVAHELAQTLIGLGRLDEAEELLRARESVDGATFQAAFDWASLGLARRNYTLAAERFLSLAQDERWSEYERLEAEFYMGYSLLEGSRFDEAIDVFERLAALESDVGEERVGLLAKGAQHQLQRALQWSSGG